MYLGIDLGTSEIKLLLPDEQHHIQAVVGSPLTVQRPQPLWSEQHPADWWAALELAMLQLVAKHSAELRQVKGIGLLGQMHGAVALDAHNAVLRPAILWNDGRSAKACVTLQTRWPALQDITGNLAMPGFTAPKLVWMQAHEPALFAHVKTVLLPKDWLRLSLSGEAISEMSDAAGTLWLDVKERRWSAPALAACGLDESAMPRLVEGSDAACALKPELAARWGLPADVVIAGGAGDNAASAVGMGAVRPHEGFVSLGTSGVIFLATADFKPNPAKAVHTFCHALPGRWHQMSVMLSAASCLSWAKQLLGQPSEAVMLEAVANLTRQQRARAPRA
jgi:xylulokinase